MPAMPSAKLAQGYRVRLFVAPPVANRRTPLPTPPEGPPSPREGLGAKPTNPQLGAAIHHHPLC